MASFPHVFLPEFNLQAEDKRREAKDAMRRLPIISSMVTAAREKTDQAKGIVDSAASESKASSSVVEVVKELTTGIQEVRTDSGAVAVAVRKRFGRGKTWTWLAPEGLIFELVSLQWVLQIPVWL